MKPPVLIYNLVVVVIYVLWMIILSLEIHTDTPLFCYCCYHDVVAIVELLVVKNYLS